MFRWVRRMFLVVLLLSAIFATTLWLLPAPKGWSRSLAIADEFPRKNVYVDWGPHFWNLRTFPPRTFIVPHYFLLFFEWDLFEKHTDRLTISYRPVVASADGGSVYWLFGSFGAGADYIFHVAPPMITRNYVVHVPIWFLVAMLWICPVVAFIRGPMRRRHRRRQGRCVRCAYALSGLTETRCPECGLEFRFPAHTTDP